MKLFKQLFSRNKKLMQKKSEFDRTLSPVITCEYHSNVAQLYYMLEILTSNLTTDKKEALLCHNVLDDNQFSFLDTETKGEKIRLHSNIYRISKDDTDYVLRYLDRIFINHIQDPSFYLYKISNISIDSEVLGIILTIISCKNCFAYVSEKNELFFGGSYTDMMALNSKLYNSYKYSDSLLELIQDKLTLSLPDFTTCDLSNYFEGLSDFNLRSSYTISDYDKRNSHTIIAYDKYPSQYHMNRQFVTVLKGNHQDETIVQPVPVDSIIDISLETCDELDEPSREVMINLKHIFECNNLPTEELSGNESLYDLIDEIIPE